jgi:oxygen-independent coproporphyrinogen-3 oxidase
VRPASVYVHFPWCLAKCPYCDFVSYAGERDAIDHRGYADAVLRELAARSTLLHDEVRISTVFFGGGTPSLWEPRELGRVLSGVRQAFQCDDDWEVTVECNPTSLDGDRARELKDVGVNRLSIGAQALDDAQLKFLGRLHDAPGALAAIKGALGSGIARVSADLIFGLPGQGAEDARTQAGRLADLGLTHLSCYQLTIEPGTRFGELARAGRLPLADDARVVEGFLAIDEELAKRGLLHYEISNYARPGEEARHNLGYWKGAEYVGLGCAAYGFVRTSRAPQVEGVRYRNAPAPGRYVEATRSARPGCLGEGDGVSVSGEALDGETMLRERIMLGLRLAAGFDIGEAARDLAVDPWTRSRTAAADRLVAQGRLARNADHLCIPRQAWVWTDDTAARLF